MADTYQRSLDHWSEAKRQEMDAFYALATADYRHLAEAFDWRAFLEARQGEAGERPLRLLDVACGSGKFPDALCAHAGVQDARIQPVAYSLLDPSAFSLSEARAALKPPFMAEQSYETTLQDFHADGDGYDIVWATHALYAVPQAELDHAMERFLKATRGSGVIANALADSHYIRFYEAFLQAFQNGTGERYRTGEELVASLKRLGATVHMREVTYTQASGSDAVVEGYLQRCAFDDTVSLSEMRNTEPVASYLNTCRHEGDWHFDQRVALIFVTP